MRGKQVELTAEVRTEVGKRAAKRLRAAGRVPAVVYGRGVKPVPVAVDVRAFVRALPETAWGSTLIRLRMEREEMAEGSGRRGRARSREGGARSPHATETVMIAEVQRDPVRQSLLAIDFRRISLQETVRAHVPVVHLGECPGVKAGGVLEYILHEVEVECLPTALPDHVEADVSALSIGDTLRVKDLKPIPEVKILAHEDDVLFVVAPPTKVPEVVAAPPAAGAVVAETPEPEVIRKKEEEESA